MPCRVLQGPMCYIMIRRIMCSVGVTRLEYYHLKGKYAIINWIITKKIDVPIILIFIKIARQSVEVLAGSDFVTAHYTSSELTSSV